MLGAKTKLAGDYVFAVRGAGSLVAVVLDFCSGRADVAVLGIEILAIRQKFARSVIIAIVDEEAPSRNLFMALQSEQVELLRCVVFFAIMNATYPY
jgi:hypothetical protein